MKKDQYKYQVHADEIRVLSSAFAAFSKALDVTATRMEQESMESLGSPNFGSAMSPGFTSLYGFVESAGDKIVLQKYGEEIQRACSIANRYRRDSKRTRAQKISDSAPSSAPKKRKGRKEAD